MDTNGGIQKGTSEAESEELLRARFEEQGFKVTEVTVLKGQKTKKTRYGKVKLASLSVFCRQFSTMVDAGVSLVRCLDVLSRQTQDTKLKKILIDIGERVEGGESLSRAMQRHPRTFNNLFIGLVKAGEIGGVLEESLQRLSTFLEGDMNLRRKVKAAMTYPVLVMVAAVGIVIFLVTWVVPQFAKLFVDIGLKPDDFPAMTKFLIDLSATFTQRWWMYLTAIIVTAVAWKLFTSTHFGLRVKDKMKLKIGLRTASSKNLSRTVRSNDGYAPHFGCPDLASHGNGCWSCR
jgi:type IV pilus assembly protein PilC